MNNYTTPEDFGAKADGLTDNYAALQAAIDYCISTNIDLRLRPGIYNCGQQLAAQLGDSKKISIIGVGEGQGTLTPEGSTVNFNGASGGLLLKPVAGSTTGSLTSRSTYNLERFKIFCSGPDKSFGLQVGDSTGQLDTFAALNNISNVSVVGNWVTCLRACNTRQLFAYRSMFYSYSGNANCRAVHILCDSPTRFCGDLQFSGCNTYTNPGSGAVFNDTVRVEATSGGTVSGVHFTDCINYEGLNTIHVRAPASNVFDVWFTSCGSDKPNSANFGRGMLLDGSTAITFNDFTIQGHYAVWGEHCFEARNSVTSLRLSDSYFALSSNVGILLDNLGGYSVVNNRINNANRVVAGPAIELRSNNFAVNVNGNIVGGNTSSHIVGVTGTLNTGSVQFNTGDVTTGAISVTGSSSGVYGVDLAPNMNTFI